METEEGEKLFREIKRRGKRHILPRRHPERIRVSKIAKDIIKALQKELKLERFKLKQDIYNRWEVLVVKNLEYENACVSFLGGKIIITTGLLCRYSTDAKIAAVLAHEVAHVVARHIAEGTKLLCKPLGDYGSLSETMSMLLSPLSRRQKKEADYIGLMLMAAGGYDPRIAPQRYFNVRDLNLVCGKGVVVVIKLFKKIRKVRSNEFLNGLVTPWSSSANFLPPSPYR
ncbi:hypothetical protein Tsubulata_016146 [Turnera subulata]|uniref:Peptidase M48 domain-containing protein n=1 Tax=Turnera subulata TaxID=218843 RepID=A0A9Q0FY18_9ROSI|nr:hypothetical protein Tsubulata_016146 [Turnera subulata]